MPPTISNRVVSLVFSLYPKPNEDSNKIMDGIPKDTPLCRSPRFNSPNPSWEVNVLIVSSVKSTIPITASICETSLLLLVDNKSFHLVAAFEILSSASVTELLMPFFANPCPMPGIFDRSKFHTTLISVLLSFTFSDCTSDIVLTPVTVP